RLAVRFSGMMGLRPCCALESVLKLGGAGDRPAPLGDPPTGTAASNVVKRPCPLAQTFALVPSGESPDGTGGSPVLPASHFSNTRLGQFNSSPAWRCFSCFRANSACAAR